MVMKKPKFDITKLMELHQGGGEDEGAALGRPEGEEAQNVLSAEVAAEAEVSDHVLPIELSVEFV